MSARLVSSAHVCLRCQLRLLRRSQNPISSSSTVLLPRQSLRLQHNDARDHSFLKSSDDAPYETKQDNNGDSEQSPSDNTSEWSPPSPEPPEIQTSRQLSRHPLGRTRGAMKWGHNLLRESTEHLNAETLGTPAEVVVLRDANFKYIPAQSSIIEEVPVKSVDLFAELDAETGISGEEEVLKNIESLRPKNDVANDWLEESVVLNWAEFEKLERILRDGFRTSQLSRYVKHYEEQKQRMAKQVSKDFDASKPSGLIRRTNWYPGITPPKRTSFDESPRRGYASVAFGPKQHLALRILRDCWNVQVRELLESVGELELHLGTIEFRLLSRYTGPEAPLSILSNAYLGGENEKIEAIRSRRTLRITTRKAQADLIATEIEKLLSNFRSEDIDLKPLYVLAKIAGNGEFEFKKEQVDQLSDLTSSIIEQSSDHLLKIDYINDAAQSGLSTPADIVRRLLLTSSYFTPPTTHVIFRDSTAPVRVLPVELSQAMPWRDRLQQWVKFSSPVTKEYKTPKDQDDDQDDFASQLRNMARTNIAKKDDNSTWLQDATKSSTITLGSVLNPAFNGSRQKFDKARAKFVPTTSYFSQVMRTLSASNNLSAFDTTESSLLLKFIASPWTAAGIEAVSHLIPPLEIKLNIHEDTTEAPYLTHIRAIKEKQVLQLMIPDRSLDMCLQQAAHIELSGFQPLKLLVDDFLNQSQLDPNQGSLKTPSQLSLPIRSDLCDINNIGDPTQTTDVTYLFAGLEYRTHVSFKFEGWEAQYTSIEAGKADGRRSEVTLHLEPMQGRNKGLVQNEYYQGLFYQKGGGMEYDRNLFWEEDVYQGFIESASRLVDLFDVGPSPDSNPQKRHI